MWESLSNAPGSAVVAIFFVMLFLSIMCSAAIPAWRKHAAAKMDHELKLEMVARGMSADEIERVLNARSAQKPDLDDTQPYPRQ